MGRLEIAIWGQLLYTLELSRVVRDRRRPEGLRVRRYHEVVRVDGRALALQACSGAPVLGRCIVVEGNALDIGEEQRERQLVSFGVGAAEHPTSMKSPTVLFWFSNERMA